MKPPKLITRRRYPHKTWWGLQPDEHGILTFQYRDQVTGRERTHATPFRIDKWVRDTPQQNAARRRQNAEHLKLAKRFAREFTAGHCPIPAPILGGPGGAMLTPEHERVLGRSAMTVWRHLMSYSGNRVSVARLVADTGLSDKTVDRALFRLAQAGAIEKFRKRVGVGNPTHTVVAGEVVKRWGKWKSELEVRVYGLANREAIVGQWIKPLLGTEVWAPASVIEWCRTHRGRGRPRKNMTLQTSSPETGNADLGHKPDPPKKTLLREEIDSSFLRKEECAAAGPAAVSLPDKADKTLPHPVPAASLPHPVPAGRLAACRELEARLRANPPRLADGTPEPAADLVILRVAGRSWPPYVQLRLAELAAERHTAARKGAP